MASPFAAANKASAVDKIFAVERMSAWALQAILKSCLIPQQLALAGDRVLLSLGDGEAVNDLVPRQFIDALIFPRLASNLSLMRRHVGVSLV